MLKIKEIKAKSIIVKSGLDVDYVINPYVGCQHSCIYCYGRFMKRFTNHLEPWGKFLDVKINAAELIPKNTKKYQNKSIMISSVTDPYQPAERKYKLMRGILENLLPLEPDLCVLTKSDLITRDIDLLKKFKKCIAGVSLSLLDDSIRKQVEPYASSVEKRINATKQLKKARIKTFIFISPMFPELTHWKEIVERTRNFADEYWFENLNLYPSLRYNIFQWLKNHHPELVKKYQEIYPVRKSRSLGRSSKNPDLSNGVYFTPLEISKKPENANQKTTKFLTGFTQNDYWDKAEKEIEDYGNKNNLNFKIYFHPVRG